MTTKLLAQAKKFHRDEDGTVAVIFGLMITVIVMFVGLAVDIGRAVHSNTRLAQALDAASLAAVKGMRVDNLTDAEAIALATSIFNENMAHTSGRWTDIHSVSVTLDRAKSSAVVNVDASVKTSFASVMGVYQIDLPKSSSAVFDIKDIEVSVQLDLTGSMCSPCSKIQALRDSTAELIDILLPDSGQGAITLSTEELQARYTGIVSCLAICRAWSCRTISSRSRALSVSRT